MNLVWHHNYGKPKMQLISKAQHTASKCQRIFVNLGRNAILQLGWRRNILRGELKVKSDKTFCIESFCNLAILQRNF